MLTTCVKQIEKISAYIVMADDVLTAKFCGKGAKLSKLGKNCKKEMGAKDQPCYNSFRILSDRVVTALQCM